MQPQIHSVKAVTVPSVPLVEFSRFVPTDHFHPGKVKRFFASTAGLTSNSPRSVAKAVSCFSQPELPSSNLNRGRSKGDGRKGTGIF